VTEVRDFKDRGEDNFLLIRDNVADYQIGNISRYKMSEEVKEGIYSIFPFSSYTEYTYTHLLLVGKDGYTIINMRNPLVDNLELLVDFMKDNPVYTKEKSLLYIKDLIRIHNLNYVQYRF
jgi:hypothetical protein